MCLAVGAVWGFSHGRSLEAVIRATIYLLLCGFALLFPGHLLRLLLDARYATGPRRLLVMQVYLAICAALIVATIAGQLGWLAPIAVLASGNALWALELEERAAKTSGR